MKTPLVVPLHDAADPSLAGGKAHNLSRLIALGAPVPGGVVLTREAFDALQETSSSAATAVLRRRMLEQPLPEAVAGALDSIASSWLPGGPLAVRSSAVGEDGATASFAGQFDSVLHVSTAAGLERAVRQCWASLWSERAIAYRGARRLETPGMAVILQRQVDAAAAGVVFTRHPDAAHGDDLLIEYCAGLSDGLVSGAVNPGRLRIPRATGVPVEEAASDIVVPLPSVRRLMTAVLSLEAALGGPQDVEWALDRAGKIWIVQARPITSSAARITWTNANVAENFPDPLSPLLYSIASTGYAQYFRRLGLAFGVSRRRLEAMDRYFAGIIGAHGARMYYNLTNIHAVLRLAPFGDTLASAFNRFVGVTAEPASPPGARTWRDRRTRLAMTVEVLVILACTCWRFLFLKHRVRAFERAADEFAARTHPSRLAARPLPRLGDDLAAFIAIRRDRWLNASLADAAALLTDAALARTLARLGHGNGLHSRLLRALPGVPSSQPPLRLWDLSRSIRNNPALCALFASAEIGRILAAIRTDPAHRAFRDAFDRYLDEWGFRSSRELMLDVPGLDERPEPVIDLLRTCAQSDDLGPHETMAAQAAARRHETRELLTSLRPWTALWVWWLIGAAQRAIAYRERVRLKQALLYSRCRAVALAIGRTLAADGRLGRAEDIFMFTWQELDEIAGGRSLVAHGLRELAAARRRAWTAESRLAPPDTFQLPEGATYGAALATLPARGIERVALDPLTLRGTGACGGRVSGRAAVLADVAEAHRLERGDVLVTRQTDPGWGAVFCLVSGLVIERGGMLSHGAIIAREFGLPCIVGVPEATRRIAHGAMLQVDGDAGTCRLVRA
jgi:pyruvate,water dikinase